MSIESIFYFGVVIGVLFGEIITFIFILMVLHKKWYGTYFIKKRNLPFSKKLKENLDLPNDFYFTWT